MNRTLSTRLVAEALGTFILVFFGGAAALTAGSGVAAGFAFGAALAVAILLVGPVSGGHLNPAVTTALAARGRFAWREVPGYALAQLAGAFVAALAIWATYGDAAVHSGLAVTHLSPGAQHGARLYGAVLAELIATFLLCIAVIALTDPAHNVGRFAALGIGLSLTSGALAIGAITGGSMNPARTLGPEIGLAMAGGKTDWSHVWVYIVGPLLGALVAAIGYGFVMGMRPTREATRPAGQPAQA